MEPSQIGNIVRRIPIFQGFSEEQIDRTLKLCQERTYLPDEYLFKEGDPSTGMLILLSGHLHVQTSTGAEIASIWEMGLVGEMGVLTGNPRSASVLASQASTVLCIERDALFGLMEEDKDMGFKVYRNVAHILCDRLCDNNILLEQQYLILEELAGDEEGA